MCYAPLVNVPPHLHHPRIVEEIGKNCKKLGYINDKSRLAEYLNWQTAEVLVRNLKSIRKLSWKGVIFQSMGCKYFCQGARKILV